MKIHVFNVSISLISSARLAGENDIKRILGIDHIPAAMKPLLRQAVLPQEALNPLAKQRGRARTLLLQHASRSDLFGWVIDPGEQSTLIRGLEKLREEFYAEKQLLLDSYEKIAEEHLKTLREECEAEAFEHTDAFLEVVRQAQPAKQYLDDQLKFEFLRPKHIELLPSEEGIVREGVLGNALHEVAQRAAQAMEAQTPKAKLSAIDEIVRKVNGLSYIAPPLRRIANEIEQILTGMPRGIRNKDYGPLHTLALSQILLTLSDEVEFAAALKNGETLFHVDSPTPDLLGARARAVPADAAPAQPTVTHDTVSVVEVQPDPAPSLEPEAEPVATGIATSVPGDQPAAVVETEEDGELVW